jgi:hypothetical protein
MDDPAVRSDAPARDTCAQCGKALAPADTVVAQDRAFCRSCYESLVAELQRGIAAMTTDVNYPLATIGAVLGGALGIAIWWGVTVFTHVAFGLVAVAIGWLAGQGAVRFAGDKRSTGLQAIAVVVSLASFAVASYLVNMTFINGVLAERGVADRVPFPPPSLDVFVRVVTAGFGVMDVVFLGIVLWEAWRIPRPPKLPATVPA